MSRLIPFPSRNAPSIWRRDESVTLVTWKALRDCESSLVAALGQIAVFGDDDETEDPTPVGSISIAKPFLGCGVNIEDLLDDFGGDCLALSEGVFQEDDYNQDFAKWCIRTFGISVVGSDPIFVTDISIHSTRLVGSVPVAVTAVIDAARVFGSQGSPVFGLAQDAVSHSVLTECQKAGFWNWVNPLGAVQRNDANVVCHP